MTNGIFGLISEKCEGLEELEVGGEPMIYNTVFNKKGNFFLLINPIGVKMLIRGPSELVSVKFVYCSQIGNECLRLLGLRYFDS